MRGSRGIGPQAGAVRSNARATHLHAERSRARYQHRHEVRHRGAGDEKSAGPRWKAEPLACPFRDLALHFNRHVVAPAKIGVEAGCQHLRQHADRRAAAMDPTHESGMRVAGRIGKNVASKIVIRRFERVGRAGDGLTKPVANMIGNRLPHRPCPNVLEVIEHVVQHPVPLSPQIVPVGRVERGPGRLFVIVHCQAARASRLPAYLYSMAINASNTLRICASL